MKIYNTQTHCLTRILCTTGLLIGLWICTGSRLSAQTFDKSAKGYITFTINTHDWLHVDQSADIILKLIDLYERNGVRGDIYLTSQITRKYVENRPDLIRRLHDSDMTISYHVRQPHVLNSGFHQNLPDMNDEKLAQTLRDYETYRLDMSTGNLLRDQPGGYSYVAEVFGRKPVTLGLPARNPRLKKAARRVYKELGAKAVVEHHESGTKPELPFEWIDSLLIRPSDFSVTRWPVPGNPKRVNFWWNMLSTPHNAAFNPTTFLKKQLAQWDHPRPPIITCLIHENNYFRARSTPFALIYYEDRSKKKVRKPPFDINGPDASVPRPQEDRELVWNAYEELVAWAAANLKVVTTEDLVRMAEAERSSGKK
jgi:hypothetical protein